MAFQITKMEYKPLNVGTERLLRIMRHIDEDNRICISFQDVDGGSSLVTFWTKNQDGSPSNSGLAKLSTLYQVSAHDYTSDSFELDDLVGKYILADVENSGRCNKDGVPYVNVKNFKETDKKFDWDKPKDEGIDEEEPW